jgi:dTDP-4-amino-4,6-dideoxygalactose transaminase
MNINYVDLSVSEDDFDKNYAPLLKDCFLEGHFVGGEEIEKFENNFAKLCGVKYAISMNSGTDALILSLIALGIKKGDEVITVANSFMATVNAIKLVGATPIFVEVNDDMLIDTTEIEKVITKKTKVILPVHLSGLICNMEKITQLAKKYNLYIIEDAAQAVGSKYKNKMSGNLGTVGCFSLHPLKNLAGIGDGGIVTTNKKRIYNKLKLLRNHGMIDRDHQSIIGYNSRLDTINAKILNYRINNIASIIQQRRLSAKYYINYLKDLKEIKLPFENKYCYHTYHTFVIQAKYRDKLQKFLLENGIETKIHYPVATIKQKPYKNMNIKLDKTLKCCDSILSLPIGNISIQEIEYISGKIIDFYKRLK